MTRQTVVGGPSGPAFVSETGTRTAVVNAAFLSETAGATSSSGAITALIGPWTAQLAVTAQATAAIAGQIGPWTAALAVTAKQTADIAAQIGPWTAALAVTAKQTADIAGQIGPWTAQVAATAGEADAAIDSLIGPWTAQLAATTPSLGGGGYGKARKVIIGKKHLTFKNDLELDYFLAQIIASEKPVEAAKQKAIARHQKIDHGRPIPKQVELRAVNQLNLDALIGHVKDSEVAMRSIERLLAQIDDPQQDEDDIEMLLLSVH